MAINDQEKNNYHIPVLAKEVMDYLLVREDGIYVDFTFGLGGHSRLILKKIKDGKLISFDWDKKSLDLALQDHFFLRSDFFLINDNFVNFLSHFQKLNIQEVDGVLLDLGLSLFQINCPQHGLSFRLDVPLNMKIGNNNSNNSLTAEKIINNYSASQLTDIFWQFGEEKFASLIAKKIVQTRQIKPLKSTQQLVSVIASCFPKKKKKHPARKVFQSLRIYLNKELENLTFLLNNIFNYLAFSAKVIVISYNSLEDRIVKNIFKEKAKSGSFQIITKKVIVPTKEEIENNNCSRSAKMRIIKKV